MQSIGTDFNGREHAIMTIASIKDAIPTLPDAFVLFVAGDTEQESLNDLLKFANHILDRGCVYVCTWGRGCERLHDLFDIAAIERSTPESEGVLMTTWHSSETLQDALHFFVRSTTPDPDFAPEPGHAVALLIGNAITPEAVNRAITALITPRP